MDSIDPAALSLHPQQHHQQQYYHQYQPPQSSLLQSPSPTPSSSSLAPPQHQQHQQHQQSVSSSSIQDPNLPPKPDRSKHDAIKARYRVLQNKWHDLSADRTKLAADLEAAEQKRDKLQAEADMLIEQMHELAPHISLAPDHVDLSSDEEGHDDYHHRTGNGRYAHPQHNGGSGAPLSSYYHLDDRGQHTRGGQYNGRRMSSDSNVPSSSINYFSGQLFGPNSGLDFGSDLDGGGTNHSSTHSSKRSSNAGHNGGTNAGSANTARPSSSSSTRQVMLSPEQAREEEARIEEEQKARERTKSYNPDNVKVRIGVMPSTFVHPLVHGTSNRSSKSRSPSTPSDPTAAGSSSTQAEDGSERSAKRPRTTSKEKSPFKEHSTIKEEDEPNPP
ncbi:hypothetical protein P389DRAFT_192193 [Cystobasidium minutum MCA 4210]|uniref:uncharacterized protein n=1 Tax=Cystobasidium minutum MCA 4210 TaxID=1397322 RepID=UPI0034CF3AC5|eukprot:jgi/Rhomi1/192193/gm1.407_g